MSHLTSGLQVSVFCPFYNLFAFPFQSKIHAARSLSEIAIDLTETGTLKTSKLANMGSKGKIISGSSGSLLSSGRACARDTFHPMASPQGGRGHRAQQATGQVGQTRALVPRLNSGVTCESKKFPQVSKGAEGD